MGSAAHANRGEVERAWLRLRRRDEVASCPPTSIWGNNEHSWRDAQRDHRGKVPQGIETQVGIKRRRDGKRRTVGKQRMAIRLRSGDEGTADSSAGATTVLNNDTLAELIGELI